MREKTSCVGEEKVNERSYKHWDLFQTQEMTEVAADAM